MSLDTKPPLPVSVTSTFNVPERDCGNPVLVVTVQVSSVESVSVQPAPPDDMLHAYVNGPVPPTIEAVTLTDAGVGNTVSPLDGSGVTVTTAAEDTPPAA